LFIPGSLPLARVPDCIFFAPQIKCFFVPRTPLHRVSLTPLLQPQFFLPEFSFAPCSPGCRFFLFPTAHTLLFFPQFSRVPSPESNWFPFLLSIPQTQSPSHTSYPFSRALFSKGATWAVHYSSIPDLWWFSVPNIPPAQNVSCLSSFLTYSLFLSCCLLLRRISHYTVGLPFFPSFRPDFW